MKRKKFLFLIIVVGLALLFSSSGTTDALVGGFGGKITFLNPACTAPPGVFVTLSAPNPGPYMYLWGTTRTYANGPPKNPGQWLLGRTAPAPAVCLVPCPAGLCPAGAGPLIMMLGSSSL